MPTLNEIDMKVVKDYLKRHSHAIKKLQEQVDTLNQQVTVLNFELASYKETEYLLKSSNNKKRLEEAIDD